MTQDDDKPRMLPQEYLRRAKDWCLQNGAPAIIKRGEHADQWWAWQEYFRYQGLKWSAGQMAGLMASFTVPSPYPWIFDQTYSEYDARQRVIDFTNERLAGQMTPQRRAYIIEHIDEIADEYRRKNPRWLRQFVPAMLKPHHAEAAE